jgi:hypothetical protein
LVLALVGVAFAGSVIGAVYQVARLRAAAALAG